MFVVPLQAQSFRLATHASTRTPNQFPDSFQANRSVEQFNQLGFFLSRPSIVAMIGYGPRMTLRFLNPLLMGHRCEMPVSPRAEANPLGPCDNGRWGTAHTFATA
jgi:hypothetical protein